MDTLVRAPVDHDQPDSSIEGGLEDRNTRNPMLLLRLSALFLLRAEERNQSVLLFHEPPRIARGVRQPRSRTKTVEPNRCSRKPKVSACPAWPIQLWMHGLKSFHSSSP